MSDNAKTWIVVAIVGGVILIIGMLTSLGIYLGAGDSVTKTYTTQPDTIEPEIEAPEEADRYDDFIPGAEDIFVDACVGAGGQRSTCVCQYRYLDTTLTNSEFYDLTLEAEDKTPEGIVEATRVCLSEA